MNVISFTPVSRGFPQSGIGPPVDGGFGDDKHCLETGSPVFALFGLSQLKHRWLKPNSENPRERRSIVP
jgi:hypothetical protein